MPSKIELTSETKYQLLLQISHKVRDTLELDVILNHLLETVKSVVDYDAAGIFVLNKALVHPRAGRPANLIAGVARRGFDPNPSGTDPMLTFGHGIVGHVIRTSESVVVPDVSQDSRYVVGRAATRSEIAVPIIRGEWTIGALNLESDLLAAFDESDVEVLRFFADAAAISIEKAMLHRQLVDQKRVEEQLQIAHDIQQRLLPGQAPDMPGYDIAAICLPTHEIGGDYYDYIERADGKLGLVVADVSGEGVAAALVMTAFRALIRTHARSRWNPARIARFVNRILPEFTGQANFVTAVYGTLDSLDGSFRYANCGHNPPLLLRANGEIELLARTGPLLGVLPEARYTTGEVSLAPGDGLVLYTDGIVEATNQEDKIFGTDRLTRLPGLKQALPASKLIQSIIQATKEFTGMKYFLDDLAIVIIRRKALGSQPG
ncbi:MAG TPA: GAF domain-containing SpoIIE family protein phosphatase [Anaerolineales bacterium]|nr:GAF domain-containing SpoIIE family protein phosphatase [Anaerolineales bacterium]